MSPANHGGGVRGGETSIKPIFSWIIPNEGIFFKRIEEQSRFTLEGTQSLHQLLKQAGRDSGELTRIRAAEGSSDSLRHEIMGELKGALITPIDREDIYELCMALDRILDDCEDAASLLEVYRLGNPPQFLLAQSEMLTLAAKELHEAVGMLAAGKDRAVEHCRKVSALQKKAREFSREVEVAIFSQKDALLIMKQRTLSERMNRAIRSCGAAADLLLGIVVKNS